MVKLVVGVISSLMIAAVAMAAGPVYPPLVAGNYTFRVGNPAIVLDTDGIPTTPAPKSIGIFRLDEGPSPELLLCVDAGADTIVQVSVDVIATGTRAQLAAKSFEGLGCTGQDSVFSTDSAYVYFNGPQAPVVLE